MGEIALAGGVRTMSSREIADLIEKQHSHIKVSAERLAGKGVIGTLAVREFGHNGNIYTEYLLNKRDSLILVAQNCPEFTARIVDRWQELEASQALALPNFADPVAAARAWADAKESEQKAQASLALAAPKVQFFDKVVERDTLMSATQVAQKLGMSAVAMNKHLDELDVYSRNIKRARVFKQWFIDKGMGALKQTELGYSQPLFTTAGEAWVVERLTSEGVA